MERIGVTENLPVFEITPGAVFNPPYQQVETQYNAGGIFNNCIINIQSLVSKAEQHPWQDFDYTRAEPA